LPCRPPDSRALAGSEDRGARPHQASVMLLPAGAERSSIRAGTGIRASGCGRGCRAATVSLHAHRAKRPGPDLRDLAIRDRRQSARTFRRRLFRARSSPQTAPDPAAPEQVCIRCRRVGWECSYGRRAAFLPAPTPDGASLFCKHASAGPRHSGHTPPIHSSSTIPPARCREGDAAKAWVTT
jgi:hypothetical protein